MMWKTSGNEVEDFYIISINIIEVLLFILVFILGNALDFPIGPHVYVLCESLFKKYTSSSTTNIGS